MFFMLRNAFKATAVKHLMCVFMSAENVCTCVRACMFLRVCVHSCIQQLLRACFCVYVFSMILAYVDVYVRVAAYGVHVCACVCVRACWCTCVCACVCPSQKTGFVMTQIQGLVPNACWRSRGGFLVVLAHTHTRAHTRADTHTHRHAHLVCIANKSN